MQVNPENTTPSVRRPNVVLILADDMGYSDIGCYGGEIHTPNIDRLAREGVRFSQFYNSGRCCPSRASLLTGLHPHQTGIGVLTKNDAARGGYPGSLNDRCVTIAEVLKDAGYATGLSGKWHLASNVQQPNAAWPTRRGFDDFFGTLLGACSYFQPTSLTRGEANVESEAADDFYYTDAISEHACQFIGEQSQAGRPFFLYVAYTAPHWPLHARPEDIAKYRGVFDVGWDELRERRIRRLRESGLLTEAAALSARDPTQPAWADVPNKEWEARRMEVYAAQIDRMDQGIGRIVRTLEEAGELDNTLILFLSDNGACAEPMPLDGDAESFRKNRPFLSRLKPRGGGEVQVGNLPAIVPGGEDTFASYGRAWANVSNTPFRYYKRWTHEGGVATPLVVHWPGGKLANETIVPAALQLTDIVPTILHAVGVTYPAQYGGHDVLPCEGRSFLPAMRGDVPAEAPLYWEHTGNAAIRVGPWKLVREYPRDWELYDLARDRSETHDVAADHPAIVSEMTRRWEAWANRVGVIAWPKVVQLYVDAGQTEAEAAG